MADKYVNATGLRAVIDWILSAFTKKKDFDALEIGGRNLIVSNNTVNGYVNNVGTIVGTTSYKASDYIPVSPGDTITFQLWTPSSARSWIDDTYFDSNKNYVTGYGGEYITSNHIIKTYTVPEGVAYVRMSYAWATGYKVKLEKGNKATDWAPAPEDVKTAISDATNDCIKGLSVSDKTITYTKGDGSKGTITTQDTNTWRGIQNNLTSDSTTDSLAAAQGKALKALVDGKAASSHKHAKSDITDMPTSLPANGGNADTVDGKHAADLVQIIDCPDGTDSKICIGTSGKTTIYRCAGSTAFTDVPELYTRQGTIIAINFSGGGTAGSNVMWVKQIFVSAHAQTYVRYIDGSGVGLWCRDVIDVVTGSSSAQIAYKTGYTKALIEFWKTLVGTGTTASTCSSTVYDSVLVTDLSSSMTAVNGKSISSGPDFSFVYSISTGGAITPSGNFSKYRITYFN